jgi:outer membrane murein-binding lipoprotein Lpp
VKTPDDLPAAIELLEHDARAAAPSDDQAAGQEADAPA